MADASATGMNRLWPTTAPWARIMVTSGKAIAQARSSLPSLALVRPVCAAVSVRVLRASKPKVATAGAAFSSTVLRAPSHIMDLLQASSVEVVRPVR
jgi:hypothetical protein